MRSNILVAALIFLLFAICSSLVDTAIVNYRRFYYPQLQMPPEAECKRQVFYFLFATVGTNLRYNRVLSRPLRATKTRPQRLSTRVADRSAAAIPTGRIFEHLAFFST